MQTFVPSERPAGGNPGARGWVKEGTEPGEEVPTIALRIKMGSTERVLMEYHITNCADETRSFPKTKMFEDLPGGAFVYDARYLVENSSRGNREGSRMNLRAVSEAYEWWKEHRQTLRVVFLCVAGQNRSVSSSIIFALSLIGELDFASQQRRSSRTSTWSIVAETSEIDGPIKYDESRGTLVHYLLRLVHEIRPQAFAKKGLKTLSEQLATVIASRVGTIKAAEIAADVEEELEAVIDYTSLWIGFVDNRNILWTLDSVVRAHLYGERWEGEEWLGRELPLRLVSVRPGPEKGRERKRKELATGKKETDESSLVLL